jgi:hypothetical protein
MSRRSFTSATGSNEPDSPTFANNLQIPAILSTSPDGAP